MTQSSVLLQPWSGPFGGLPPFHAVTVPALRDALQAAMQAQQGEIDAITTNPESATFDNTLAALELSGEALQRVLALYHIHSSTLNDEAMQALEREMEPKLAAFHDSITQNSALFARIATVWQQRESVQLNTEQQRLLKVVYEQFARTGAALNEADKQRLADINQQLASLFTEFSQRVLKDEESVFTLLNSEAELAGLPASEREAAAEEAASRDLPGKWVIANTRSAVEPFLTYSTRRDLREQVWRRFTERGDRADNDTKPLIQSILKLRAERARLLGYTTHAHWQLTDSMARTPEQANALLTRLWPAAVARVAEEVADMQALATRDGITIAAWDYRYYAEQVRKARYDLDANELKPYLQLEQLREGLFFVARQLFGLHFGPAPDVATYHADVSAWQVNDVHGQHVGLWFFDPFARRGKQSGAWMSEYRSQQQLAGKVTPIVSNNANFTKGKANEPVLVNWDDAVTLFHEFGHALHGLMSQVTYPTLAGTNVVRDFVEFPSQLLEHWLAAPEVLQRFARHVETNEPMPQTLVDKIMRARNFNQGFATLEYLASAVIDMQLHLVDEVNDVAQFEQRTLQDLGMPSEVVMRHRTPHFSHVFSGDGYAAGYYSYLWADTLVADAWEAFVDKGDVFDAELATRLRQHVFTAGNREEPDVAYRAFRGRDASIDALLRKRGFSAS